MNTSTEKPRPLAHYSKECASQLAIVTEQNKVLIEALEASPCGRLLLQCEHVSNADVSSNCLGCACWRAALAKVRQS